MNALSRAAGAVTLAAILLALGLAGYSYLAGRTQDLPWTALALDQPVGWFTGRKLAALTGDAPQCLALLDRAGVRYSVVAPMREGACGYSDGVRRKGSVAYTPRAPATSCAVAAALTLWERAVVQPAARRRFGTDVSRIEHLGSYACRRIYGRTTGPMSEHATADAIDIAGFVLADGRRVSVLGDWRGGGEKAAFLRDVRSGGCRLFATVLSPDYNPAHRDHLHLDQAERGATGWRACR